MNSVPPAVSPRTADDAEVASQRAPGQEEVVLEEPQGDLPDSRSKGDKTPRAPSLALSQTPRRIINGSGPRQANSCQEEQAY